MITNIYEQIAKLDFEGSHHFLSREIALEIKKSMLSMIVLIKVLTRRSFDDKFVIDVREGEDLSGILFAEPMSMLRAIYRGEQASALDLEKVKSALRWLTCEVERDHELDRLSVDSEDCAKSARKLLESLK